jgi:hypothetical protein
MVKARRKSAPPDVILNRSVDLQRYELRGLNVAHFMLPLERSVLDLPWLTKQRQRRWLTLS